MVEMGVNLVYDEKMPQYKKESPIFKILEILGHASLATVDILDMMLSGYPRRGGMSKESYKKMRQRIEMRHSDFDQALEDKKERQRFYSLISKIHKEGLIEKIDKEKRSSWKITEKGEDELLQWSRKIDRLGASYLPPDLPRNYKTTRSQHLIIVIFDIPEKERNKRDWLRDVLNNLEFKKLQKSVMIGYNKIPEELLSDLRRLKIFKNVHVFSVRQEGTIDRGQLE